MGGPVGRIARRGAAAGAGGEAVVPAGLVANSSRGWCGRGRARGRGVGCSRGTLVEWGGGIVLGAARGGGGVGARAAAAGGGSAPQRPKKEPGGGGCPGWGGWEGASAATAAALRCPRPCTSPPS